MKTIHCHLILLTPVKSKLNSCQAFAAVTPTDSFSNAAPAPSNFNKVFYPQLKTKLLS
jgi:hypothetical protein